MPLPSVSEARQALAVREARVTQPEVIVREGSAASPSGQYDFEFGIPYNANLRHLTGAEFQLRELTREEREEVWRRAHQAWERNPWAKNAIRTIRSYVTGTGHTMSYRAAAVKELLEAFRLDPENAVEQYDKELCEQLLIDGELFIRFTEPDTDESDTPTGSRLVIDPVPPWWVLAIRTDPNFRKRVTGYVVQFSVGETPETAQPEEPLEVAPDLVLHVTINKLAYEQRGRSELMAVLPWLKALKDFIEDRARINRFKGNVYFHLNLEGATAAQVAAARAQYRTPPPPASILVTGGKQTFQSVAPNINASDAKEDGRAIRLASAVGFGMPEYMFAGDAAESNLATAEVQREPAERNFEDYRDILVNRLWRPIYRRAIELAARAGTLGVKPDEAGRYLLPEIDADGEPVTDKATGAPKLVDAFEAFDLTYPPLREEDPKNLAEALHLLMVDRLISRVTAQERAGIDPQIEAKRLAAEDEEDQARLAQGLGIGANGPDGDERASLGGRDDDTDADEDDDTDTED